MFFINDSLKSAGMLTGQATLGSVKLRSTSEVTEMKTVVGNSPSVTW